MRLLAFAALLSTATAGLAVEPVDSCATVLGSIGVELRFARSAAPGKRSTYECAKRYTPLIGATRERVLRSLGTPDRNTEDGGWSYLFHSKYDELAPGTPELVFRFGGEGLVESVDCRRTA